MSWWQDLLIGATGSGGIFSTLLEGLLPNYRDSNRYSVNVPQAYTDQNNFVLEKVLDKLGNGNNQQKDYTGVIIGVSAVLLVVVLLVTRSGGKK